jgi:hypothetical protein
MRLEMVGVELYKAGQEKIAFHIAGCADVAALTIVRDQPVCDGEPSLGNTISQHELGV